MGNGDPKETGTFETVFESGMTRAGDHLTRRYSRRSLHPWRCFLLQAIAALFLSVSPLAAEVQFTIDPLKGPASGGEVKFEFNSAAGARSVREITFGNGKASFSSPAGRTIVVQTPPYGGSGEQVDGGFRVHVFVNGRETNNVFTYLDENAPAEVSRPQDERASRGATRPLMTIEPPYGTANGRETVTLRTDAPTPACDRPQITFGRVPVTPASGSAGEVLVMTPIVDLPPRQWLMPVNVSLRCQGRLIGSGTFLYVDSAHSVQPRGEGAIAMILALLVVGGLLWWRLSAVEKRLSTLQRSVSARPPPPPATSLDDIVAMLRKIEEACRNIDAKINEVLRWTRNPVLPGTAPKQPVGDADIEQPVDETQILQTSMETDRAPQPQTVNYESRPSKGRSRGPFGPMELASIWNEANSQGHNDQRFIELVRNELSGPCEFRTDSGLIVVSAKGADLAWVVPAMNPILHRSALQNFFQIRGAAGDRATVTLIQPATIPKSVDINGYTAGQITRGVLEK